MNQKLVRIFFLLAIFPLPANTTLAIELNSPAPEFTLSDYGQSSVSLSQFKDKVVILEWFNSGCPFVQKHYRNGDMQALQKKYGEQGVVWLIINSTHKNHTDYLDPEKLAEVKKKYQISDATTLEDSAGDVGKAYQAKTTPHLYVINKGILVYQGAIDDNNDPSSDPKQAKSYLQLALDETISGKPVSIMETTPYGCSVKYDY